MIVVIKTIFNKPPEEVWHYLKKRDTFLYITRGILGFTGSEGWPDEFYGGIKIKTRLLLFHFLPLWKHNLRVVRMDKNSFELYSNESGGPIKIWNHLISIKAIEENKSLYTDQVEIVAKIFTLFIWLFANIFYRYRQFRWEMMLKL